MMTTCGPCCPKTRKRPLPLTCSVMLSEVFEAALEEELRIEMAESAREGL